MARGEGRNAHVHGTSRDAQADAAVLRQAFFRDVELGHDLDARSHERRKHAARLQHLAQHAIDAVTHHQAVFIGLDVDVRGSFFHGLGEQGVDEPDDGRVVLALEQVLGLGQGLRDAREIHVIVAEIAHDVHGLARALLVGQAQLVIEAVGVDGLERDGGAEIAAHLGQRRGAHVRAAPDDGAAVVPLIDQHAVLFGVGVWQPPRRLGGGWRGGGEFVGLGSHRGKIDLRAFGGAISNGGGKSRISSSTGITGTSSPGINATPFCCISSCRARMKLYLPDDTCARRPSSRMMSGCRNTIRFVLSLLVKLKRNRLPSSGRSPSSGTFCVLSRMLSVMSPPSTTTSPSSTSTPVRIERVLVMRSAAPCTPAARLSTFCSTSSLMVLPSLICGLTLRVRPTFLRLMVWKGLVGAAEPLTLVNEPVTKGTSWPFLFSVFWLSSVTRVGVDKTLVAPSPCSSRINAAKLTPFLLKRPKARFKPSGRLVMPVVPPAPPSAAPAISPRLLPLPDRKLGKPTGPCPCGMASTAHCTPSCAALFIEISAMIASTTTCARRTSNWRLTACSGRNTSIGAVITRALVLSSACMVKPCPCCARLGLAAAGVAPPAAGARRTSSCCTLWPMPVSTGTISFAFA